MPVRAARFGLVGFDRRVRYCFQLPDFAHGRNRELAIALLARARFTGVPRQNAYGLAALARKEIPRAHNGFTLLGMIGLARNAGQTKCHLVSIG